MVNDNACKIITHYRVCFLWVYKPIGLHRTDSFIANIAHVEYTIFLVDDAVFEYII